MYIFGTAHGKIIQRTYDEATRKLKELVEKVELWAGTAKPEFLNAVEKLIREGANPNVKDQVDMPLAMLLIRTPDLRLKLFTVDIPMLEKTLTIVLDNGADVNELISNPFFLDHLADAPLSMIQMFLDHMPIENPIQQKRKQVAKNEIIKLVKQSLEFETKQLAMHKRYTESEREKSDRTAYNALVEQAEKDQKEVDRLRKTLEVLEGKLPMSMQPNSAVRSNNSIFEGGAQPKNRVSTVRILKDTL